MICEPCHGCFEYLVWLNSMGLLLLMGLLNGKDIHIKICIIEENYVRLKMHLDVLLISAYLDDARDVGPLPDDMISLPQLLSEQKVPEYSILLQSYIFNLLESLYSEINLDQASDCIYGLLALE